MRGANLGIWGLLIPLMVAANACDNGPKSTTRKPTGTLISISTHIPNVTPNAPLTPREPDAQEALEDIVKDPMARIAEWVPGFGGAFRDSREGIVYIYLQDASMQEEAESALTEVFGPDFLESSEVEVLVGEYSMAHLGAWYKTLSGVIWQVPGIAWTDLDERKNRIEIGMRPRRGAREEMAAAIATVDVPREAIVLDVGCPGISSWPLDHGNPPDEAFDHAIDYSLEVLDRASYGETVQMKLRLQNVGDEPVSFYLGGRPPHDFVISTPSGEQIWHWKCARITLSVLDFETLEPGGSTRVRRRVGAGGQPWRAGSTRHLPGEWSLGYGGASEACDTGPRAGGVQVRHPSCLHHSR